MKIIRLRSGTVLHNGIDRILINPILKRVINKGGELSFSISKDDKGYDELYPKITFLDVIEITDIEKVIWSGRVDTIAKTDLFGTKIVVCVGVMALLTDFYCFMEGNPKTNISLKTYMSTLEESHKDSVYMVIGKTPISIYALQSTPQLGKVWIYWQEGTEWKRGTLPIVTENVADFDCFKAIFRTPFYLMYDGPEESIDIKIRAAAHGWSEKTVSDLETGSEPLWTPSDSENTYISSYVIENAEKHQWLIHDFLYLTLEPGKAHELKGYSKLLQIDTSGIESTKKIMLPYNKSFARTYDFLTYAVNFCGGFFEAVTDRATDTISLSYNPTGKKINQEIRLKRNLIDYNEDYKLDELYTGIIPYITGDSYGGKIHVPARESNIFDDLYVSEKLSGIYGPVYRMIEIDETYDIEKPAEWIKRQLQNAESDFLSITVKCFDESDFIPDIDKIEVGNIVTIKTADTKIDEICTEKHEYFNEPENNVYKFGVTPKSLNKYLGVEDAKIFDLYTGGTS